MLIKVLLFTCWYFTLDLLQDSGKYKKSGITGKIGLSENQPQVRHILLLSKSYSFGFWPVLWIQIRIAWIRIDLAVLDPGSVPYVMGMRIRIRIQQHGNWPKLTNKPGFLYRFTLYPVLSVCTGKNPLTISASSGNAAAGNLRKGCKDSAAGEKVLWRCPEWYDNFEQGFGFHIDLCECGSGSSIFSNCGSGSCSGFRCWWLKIEKIYSWKIFYFFDKKLQYYLSLGLLFTPKLQKKPSSLKREHPALRNIKCFTFNYFWMWFSPSWNLIQQLKLMRIHPDPDRKPWFCAVMMLLILEPMVERIGFLLGV